MSRFQSVAAQFGTVQATTSGIDPEQVLVLETLGSVVTFQNVVKRIAGLEWLGEFDAEVEAGDPGFLADGSDPTLQPARLFVLAGNRTAYNEILALWKAWQEAANDKLPRGFGGLAEAFKHLNDVRPWGTQDRLFATGVVAYWEQSLAFNSATIQFEAELWCRGDAAKREAAFGRLRDIVTEFGGQCLTQTALPEIDYHGVLISLPASTVRDTIGAIGAGEDTQLLRLTEIKHFSPIGQATIELIDDGSIVDPPDRPLPNRPPVVALLDGLPLTNHAGLQGRLVVDDPDDLAASYEAGEHRHGTAMASLMAHAEYDGNEEALDSRVYVRPVMAPGPPDVNGRRWETFPENELAIDLLHRAVRRMFEGEGTTPPQAPTVKAINLSLGDRWQPFDRQCSPLARLLDWLSWKYQVLFIVSAGNHENDIAVPVPSSAISAMADEDLRAHTLRAMAHQRLERRLLAPAESLNALTVGSLHAQNATNAASGGYIDLMRGASIASPLATVASGFRRSVKPEILVSGGRRHYVARIQDSSATNTVFQVRSAFAQPGQLVAACHPTGLSNLHAVRTCGSSNATALTTRRAAQLVDRLSELRAETGGELLTDEHTSVALKALLAHGASWGDEEDFLDNVFDGPDSGAKRWWRIKHACAQFLGYGPADFERGTVCTDERVIVLGCGTLKSDEGHVYHVPIPPALHAQTVRRRLTVTLAWFTPINPRHRDYRVADLWCDPPRTFLQVNRIDAHHDAVTRGTLQHEVLEGERAVSVVDGDTMPVQVNCRYMAGSKIVEGVPYALLVSLECAHPLGVSIYDQVKTRIDALRAPVGIPVRAGARSRR